MRFDRLTVLELQNGAIFSARDYLHCPRRSSVVLLPSNKILYSIKMAGYWPRSFFCLFVDHGKINLTLGK